MEKIGVITGILLCICMVWAQDATITVNDNVEVKPGQEVTLNCVGSNPDISYYIRNRPGWNITKMDGTINRLTYGFYPESKDVHTAELIAANRFQYTYEPRNINGQSVYVFELKLKDVQFSDDGEYTCSLYNEGNKPVINATTRVTVVSPVRKLTLEVHDSTSQVAQAESFTEGSEIVSLSPGQYKVMCVAMGSNPQPMMDLYYNKDKMYIVQDDTKITTGEGPTYTSSFTVESVELKSMTVKQLLLCEANIPGNYYDAKRAGIELMVKIEKPDFNCKNLTTAEGERYRNIECTLTPKAQGDMLKCDHVKWKFGSTGNFRNISFNEKYTDPNREYDIMKSSCQVMDGALNVQLQLSTVKPTHLSTTFYVVYGIGSDAEEYPIDIHLKETSGASMLTPVMLLVYMLMAFVSRKVARNL